MAEPNARPPKILVIVLIYAAAAGMWILSSDMLVGRLFSTPEQIMLISTLKGWLFVAASSFALFVLLRHHWPAMPPGEAAALPRRRLFLPMTLLVLVILGVTVGAIYFSIEQKKATEAARLQAVATLKAQQINEWLKERMGDSRMINRSLFLAENYARWRDHGDRASLQRIQENLIDYSKQYSFSGIMLLDEKGALVWHSEAVPHGIDAAQRAAYLHAAENGQVSRLGPYLDASGRIHLDFVAPLRATAGHPSPIVVLHTDTTDYLPAALRAWPAPTTSGEVMLMRREGDHVLHLNEPRHRSDMALRLKLPLAQKDLLAAQAIRDPSRHGSLLEGVDYRGVPVLGIAHAILDSDWVLMVKIDRSEFYGAAASDAGWIALAGVLALFIAAATLFLSRQRQALVIANQIQLAQNERLRALHLLAAIADSSADAIFAKDQAGRYLLFNRAAERMTGKSMQDVLGCDDTALFPPEQAAQVMQHDQTVVTGNRNVTFQEELATTAGITTFLATKGPLHDESGQVIGLYSISRDISDRKRAEALLAATARFVSSAGGDDFFPALVKQAADSLRLDYVHIALLDSSRQRVETLAAWLDDDWIPNWSYDLAGTPCVEVVKLDRRCIEADVQVLYPDDAELKKIGAQGYVGEPLADRSGQAIGLIVGASRAPLRNGDMVQANLRILAARAAAEWEQRQSTQALRESERSFRLLTEQVPAIIYRASLGDLSQTLYVSPKVADLVGYTQAEWIADPAAWVEALHPDDRQRVLQTLEAFHATGGELSLEYRLHNKAGEWRYFQDEAQILRDDAGQPLYLQGLMLDVTARHEVEAQLGVARAQADMLADLLNRSAQPFVQRFADGSLGFNNPAFRDLVGYTAAECAQLNLANDLTPPEWLSLEQEKQEELRRSGKPVTYEKEYLRKDGSRVPIELLLHLIRDEAGQPRYYYAFITDISKRKQAEENLLQQAEELRRRNEELERFNRASVGRELDMIKLKQRINALSQQLGQTPPFDLSFADPAAASGSAVAP